MSHVQSERNLQKFGNKGLTSLSTCRHSLKAEYQTLQLGTCEIVRHYSHWLFFVFRFQAFSSYLKVKRAQYTARSKWKSQTKSFEAFWGLFRFRAMNNVINGHICCIFNSLYKQNTHNMQSRNNFYLIQPSRQNLFLQPPLAHNRISEQVTRETAASAAAGRVQPPWLPITRSAAGQSEETLRIPACP